MCEHVASCGSLSDASADEGDQSVMLNSSEKDRTGNIALELRECPCFTLSVSWYRRVEVWTEKVIDHTTDSILKRCASSTPHGAQQLVCVLRT